MDTGSDSRVRLARPTDAARLRELQALLREPSPELLDYGIAVGSVAVSVAGQDAIDSNVVTPDGVATPDRDGAVDPPTHSNGDPSTVVGYLLAVDGPDRPGIHLAELAVDSAFRREARARGLLETALQRATGAVTLQVHAENDAACSLYTDLGFEVTDRRIEWYADGDALIMRRG